MRLSALTFAGGSARRPYPGAPAAAGPGTHGGARASRCEVSRGRRAHRASDDAVVSGRRSSRLATRGARVDRVGAKLLPRAIAVGEVAMGPASPCSSATPEPWNLGWPARASETRHPQPGTSPKGRDLREKSCTSGRLRVWCCGARTFVVVLVDRFDCRSRQAVPGIGPPRVKSARNGTLPSHPSREQRLANGPRKPTPRGEARRTVTGSHPIPGMASVERP